MISIASIALYLSYYIAFCDSILLFFSFLFAKIFYIFLGNSSDPSLTEYLSLSLAYLYSYYYRCSLLPSIYFFSLICCLFFIFLFDLVILLFYTCWLTAQSHPSASSASSSSSSYVLSRHSKSTIVSSSPFFFFSSLSHPLSLSTPQKRKKEEKEEKRKDELIKKKYILPTHHSTYSSSSFSFLFLFFSFPFFGPFCISAQPRWLSLYIFSDIQLILISSRRSREIYILRLRLRLYKTSCHLASRTKFFSWWVLVFSFLW